MRQFPSHHPPMATSSDMKKLRESQGWSQYRLADEMGVNQGTISKMEKGTLAIDGPAAKALELLIEKHTEGEQA